MISPQERKVFESIIIPLAFCRYEDGELITELVTDGLCTMVDPDRGRLVSDFNHKLYGAVHQDDVQWLKEAVGRFACKEEPYLDVVFRNKRRNKNEYMLLHVVGKWQRLEDGTEIIILGFNDMKRTQNAFGKLYASVDKVQSDLMMMDTVTGLPSFHYLRQFADDKIRNLKLLENTPVLAFFDVKSMHSYNRHYGYERGDELIRLIGRTIADVFPDSLLGRGVEDHFILIDAFHGDEELRKRIEEINRKVRADAYGQTDGISAGVYVIKSDEKAVQALDYARQALKDIGSDLNVSCSFFTLEKSDEYWKERYIIENFEKAMENRWIRVFYQPMVTVKDRKIANLEALARWIDPARGTISPADFIPILSRYHQLYRLDLYMAEQVCSEFAVRQEAGLALVPVSINFSAQDFDYVDVTSQLKNILRKHEVAPEKIIVEITEQEIAKGKEQFRKQLKQIRTEGHPLWVDDFGSGYSSLNVMSRYEVDWIKFDMELIRHLDENNGANRKMMRAIVNVCRELGVHTLAEGVETEEQLAFLQEIECELAQGFLFFKPESLEESIYKFQKRGDIVPHENGSIK